MAECPGMGGYSKQHNWHYHVSISCRITAGHIAHHAIWSKESVIIMYSEIGTKGAATMTANRPPYVRPTSITPAPDASASNVLAAAARLRTARIAGEAMDPATAAAIASQLLERGHYRAAAAAAELAAELAAIAAPSAAAELFGRRDATDAPPVDVRALADEVSAHQRRLRDRIRPQAGAECAYPGDHEHDHHMCLDVLEVPVVGPQGKPPADTSWVEMTDR